MNSVLATLLTSALLAVPRIALSQDAPKTEGQEAAYTRTIAKRADKIVVTLDLTDSAKAARVRDVIVRQYRDLNTIHSVRDAKIRSTKENSGPGKAETDAAVQAARNHAQPKLATLHAEFLARLSAELSPEQVDKVKDGMTYGVVPLTHSVYLKMYPELTDEQKKQIMAWLVEAREIAMDGSTAEEKHAVFGKYKGRINNYLSKAGYDSKKGEQNLQRANQPASETRAD